MPHRTSTTSGPQQLLIVLSFLVLAAFPTAQTTVTTTSFLSCHILCSGRRAALGLCSRYYYIARRHSAVMSVQQKHDHNYFGDDDDDALFANFDLEAAIQKNNHAAASLVNPRGDAGLNLDTSMPPTATKSTTVTPTAKVTTRNKNHPYRTDNKNNQFPGLDIDMAMTTEEAAAVMNTASTKNPYADRAARSKTIKEQQEEAGDKFPGLDIDTAMPSCTTAATSTARVTPSAASTTFRNNPYRTQAAGGSVAKRQKVSPTTTTLHAASPKQPPPLDQYESPFGPDSKFSMGTHSNPHQELATTDMMQQQQQTDSSPFAPNSKFSIGTHCDPNEFATSDNVEDFQHSPMLQDDVATLDSQQEPNNNNNMLENVEDSHLTAALNKSLSKYFGFSSFRPGQLAVLHALLLQQRDTAVFWATGQGKSLCYQVPPLHTGHVGLVVSPLISLMQDQVNKLNGLSEKKLATFLGSSQLDPNEEARALQGEYPLVYVTPEKLLSNGFLDQLAHMHQSKKRLCLVAIDESHCVSEWGHDFRTDYRHLGEGLRNHFVLQDVPIMALTATAVPRVQDDILQSLQLRHPHVARQSFDRTNLDIAIHKKSRGGFRADLEGLVQELKHETSSGGGTIIYAPSRDLVEDISKHLQEKLSDKNATVVVQPYHGTMNHAARTEAHLNFLVGKTRVIVATVAFGMGIDKPDTRRVIHYGPPKTVEEYYQQIGRAGRDGLPAQCTMFCKDGDFDKYKSDFYVGGLSGQAKAAMEQSMDVLRKFSLDTVTCRRKALLDFFNETSTFGERCGTCDNCLNHKKYGHDSERDFGSRGARLVLTAVGAVDGSAMGIIEKIMGGHQVDSYRYVRGNNPANVSNQIKSLRQAMDRKRPLSYFKELMGPLLSKGYLSQATKKADIKGYSRTWGTYRLTPLGRSVLNNTSAPIILPVPPSLREVEAKEEERRQKSLKQLKDAGIKLETLPKKEVEDGDGEVIRAFKKWNLYLEAQRRADRQDRLASLENLMSRIEQWRSTTAEELRMAPASVLAEHQVAFIAYTVSTMKAGVKVQPEALVSAGVRTRGLESLVRTLNEWIDQFQPAVSASGDVSLQMILPNEPFAPSEKWEHAVYKPNKKTGVAAWESSHTRFLNGEHPQTISMSPENGRPIQVATVVGHILDGLTLGRPVPLKLLAEVMPPPNKEEWELFERLEQETETSVTGDPNTSGIDGEKFTLTEFLRPVMGDVFVETPYKERTEEDKAKFSKLCELLKWYMALKRTNFGQPVFESDEQDDDDEVVAA